MAAPSAIDFALFDLLADLHGRFLVLAGALVEAHELAEFVNLTADLNPRGVDVRDRAFAPGPHDHARVLGHVAFHAGGHDRRFADQQRHGLPLHVRTHQRAVGVVVLQERNQAGRNADHLAGSHVDVLDFVDRHHFEVGVIAGNDRVAAELAVVHGGVGRRQVGLAFLVRAQPHHVFAELAVVDFAVGRHQKAVLVDGRVNGQAGNQTDVGAFRRLDRADAAVVRNVHVADFEAGPLAVQTAGAQRRETTFVREHRERVGLVDHLRELAAAEKILDRRRDALGIDQAARSHVFHVLQTHPLLHRAAQLQEAFAQLVASQFVDGAQTAVAQMVDIVDFHVRVARGQPEQIPDGRDQILGPQRHFVFGHVELQLAVDAEAADFAQTITIGVEEFLVEEGSRLFQLRRIARAQALIDPQQGLFVARRGVFGQAVEDQGHFRIGHDFDGTQTRGADHLRDVLGDFLTAFEHDLAGLGAVGRIDDVVDRDLAFDLADAAAVDDFLGRGVVEDADQVGVEAVFGVHGPQQGQGRELAALIDAHAKRIFFAGVQFDPAAALGNDAAAVQAAIAGFHFADEVDAGAAMQLADHDALGTVNDELAAAEHDRHVAQVNFFLDRLLFGQAEPDAERTAVGEAQLAAFVGLVAGLAQLVADVFEPQRLVVAFDRENLAKHAFDALIGALLRRDVVLEKGLVTASLNFRKIRNGVRRAQAAEATDFLGAETPFC